MVLINGGIVVTFGLSIQSINDFMCSKMTIVNHIAGKIIQVMYQIYQICFPTIYFVHPYQNSNDFGC